VYRHCFGRGNLELWHYPGARAGAAILQTMGISMILTLVSFILDISLISSANVQSTEAVELPSAPMSGSIPQLFPKAPPLAPPKTEVIRAATVEELFLAVEHVGAGGTILLVEGQYKLPRPIILREKKNISIRSAAGNPVRVTLSGQGWDSELKGDDILRIAHCEGVTIADLTFADCRSYGIKVEAENAPKDIRRQPRSERPDLGAWEFDNEIKTD